MDIETTPLPTCYRHPDRETRLACSSCDRPVCVDCVRMGDVGQRCPECSPARREVRPAREARLAVVSRVLLVVNVAVFVIAFVAPTDVDRLVYGNAAQINSLIADDGQWWRVLTAAFLHDPDTFFHILFNMWALWVFGPHMEQRVGSLPFLLLYFAAAATGGLAFYLLGDPNGVAVGASGAIFGLFGAWIVAAYQVRHTAFGQAQFRQLLVLLGINLALPLLPGSSIAWQAHLGGLVAGMFIAAVWFFDRSATTVWRALTAGSVLGAAVLLVMVLRPSTLPV